MSKRLLLKALALVCLVIVAYAPAIQGDFIWDDNDYVSENLTLRDAQGLGKIWFDVRSNKQYYPLVFTSFWIEYHLWGLDVVGYHATNIALHIVNAFLLWRVLSLLLPHGAWLAATLFAVHPVHVESVAWITERKNVLSATFYLLSVLAWMRSFRWDDVRRNFSEEPLGRLSPAWGYYLLSLGFFVCALLSKTVTSSMPAALLMLCWWKKTRIDSRDLLLLAPFLLVGLPLGLVTIWLERHHVGAQGEAWDLSAAERVLIAGRAVWFYASKLVWPHDLAFNYPRWAIDVRVWWQYLFPVGIVAAGAAAFSFQRRVGKGPFVGFLFFIVTLFPALGFFNTFPMLYSYVADHFQYLASIGPICIGAVILTQSERFLPEALRRIRYIRETLRTAMIGSLPVLLAALTWSQAHIYRDTETLWRDTLSKNPSSWMALNNLGADYSRKGRSEAAIESFLASIRLNPRNAIAYSNLGSEFATLGDVTNAKQYFRKAIQVKPDYPSAYLNLGKVLLDEGDYEGARPYLVRVLGVSDRELDSAYVQLRERMRAGMAPDVLSIPLRAGKTRSHQVQAHLYLGLLYLGSGDLPKSIGHLRFVLAVDPTSSAAHYNLGLALYRLYGIGKAAEIELHYREASRMDPDNSRAQNNLGALMFEMGRMEEAAAQFGNAIRSNPQNAEAHNNIGIVFETLGRMEQATDSYRAALRIKPDHRGAQQRLQAIVSRQLERDPP